MTSTVYSGANRCVNMSNPFYLKILNLLRSTPGDLWVPALSQLGHTYGTAMGPLHGQLTPLERLSIKIFSRFVDLWQPRPVCLPLLAFYSAVWSAVRHIVCGIKLLAQNYSLHFAVVNTRRTIYLLWQATGRRHEPMNRFMSFYAGAWFNDMHDLLRRSKVYTCTYSCKP